ncbi:MAG: exo-alpha-sialidase [Opitutaceae bacterium]|nr:exo-alpha-sialidase [Opitutaceae bacterium]
MKKIAHFLALVPWLVAALAAATGSDAVEKAIRTNGKPFLGEPSFVMQPLADGRGGRDIVTARDGRVLAFHNNTLRESADGGTTWGPSREVGADAGGKLVVNETNGEILFVRADKGYLWKSRDDGRTWSRAAIKISPNRFKQGSPDTVPLAVGAFQPGVTLQFGPHKGRLLVPGRVFGPTGSNDVEWRPYHYNAAMYSDDNGSTWQVSAPFPILGSGEGALAELSDGRILYSSREHMSKNNRFFGWSYDGGELWLEPWESDTLPDGARGTSYGCMGGLIRLPIEGTDVLIYSNLDTVAGKMPEKVGGSTSNGREKITVWASFDGGRTWPVKRLVFSGPSAYSNLGVGRNGTASAGKIFLHFEAGEKHCYEDVRVAAFNLSWLLNGRELRSVLSP